MQPESNFAEWFQFNFDIKLYPCTTWSFFKSDEQFLSKPNIKEFFIN